jgi:RNA polymerase sigma-70 factor (ECF subfamily)
MTMDSDHRPTAEQLLAESRQGKGEGLGALLELYRNYLGLVARTQIDVHLRAQVNPSDVVQETFLEAYRDFHQFQGTTEREFLAWVRRILLHNLGRLVEKQMRAQKRDVRRLVSLDYHVAAMERSAAKVEAALVSPWSSPSARVQRREMAALLADQLVRLPASYREVIVLRNLEGLTFQEVACRMNRTPAATRVLWLRALDKLREILKAEQLI